MKISPTVHAFAEKALRGEIFGDKADLGDLIPDDFHRISAEDCIGVHCQHFSTCGFQQSKKAVEDAKIIIANHALVGIDLALTGEKNPHPILGSYDILVIDEAHKAADYFRKAFASEAKQNVPFRVAKILDKRHVVYDGAVLNELERALKAIFKRLPNPEKDFERVYPHHITAGYIRDVQSFIGAAGRFCIPVRQLVNTYQKKLEEGAGLGEQQRKDLFAAKRALRSLDDLLEGVKKTLPIEGEERNANEVIFVKWERATKVLVVSPVSVGAYLQAKLYSSVPTVIATSATLTISKRFYQIQEELGLTTKKDFELAVKSPFNYARHAALYLSKNVPSAPKAGDEVGLRKYAEAVASEIQKLSHITQGRAFVLFTAKNELEEVFRVCSGTSLHLLKQDDTTTVTALIEKYLEDAGLRRAPLLFGLKSFWEGVSVEGDALLNVIIVKLPFPIQNDPIYQALCERAGDESFAKVTLPTMIRDLQQGTGRLIRTQTDIGIVSILDARVLNSQYGNTILNSLPFSARSTNLADIAAWYAKLIAQRKAS